MKNLGIYIIVAAAGLMAYSYFKLAKSINVVLKKIAFKGGLLTPKIEITMGLQNPSNNSATLKSTAGNVYINEKFFSSFSNFASQQIAANSESDVIITLKPNLFGSVSIIKDFIKNKGKGEYVVRVDGTANIDGNAIKFNQSQSL